MASRTQTYLGSASLPLTLLSAAAAAFAPAPEAFFELAAWKDSPTVIEEKFPDVKVAACPKMQEEFHADRAIGCAKHKLQSYKIADILFIVGFSFLKADQSLAEVSLFSIEPYTGNTAGLRRLCETVLHAMGRRYGVTDLVTQESEAKGSNGVAAYNAAWSTPERRSRFQLDCIPKEGNQAVVFAVLRPTASPHAPAELMPNPSVKGTGLRPAPYLER